MTDIARELMMHDSPIIEYAMRIVTPRPDRRGEKLGDIVSMGFDADGERRQRVALQAWRGWVPMERHVQPWIVSGRFDLAEEAGFGKVAA